MVHNRFRRWSDQPANHGRVVPWRHREGARIYGASLDLCLAKLGLQFRLESADIFARAFPSSLHHCVDSASVSSSDHKHDFTVTRLAYMSRLEQRRLVWIDRRVINFMTSDIKTPKRPHFRVIRGKMSCEGGRLGLPRDAHLWRQITIFLKRYNISYCCGRSLSGPLVFRWYDAAKTNQSLARKIVRFCSSLQAEVWT